MNLPRQITPQMMEAFLRRQQQMQRQGGMPGMIPMTGPPPDDSGKKDLTKYNPLKGGPNDLKILRGTTTDCPIPGVAQFFSQLTPQLLSLEGDPTEILDASGRGIATIMGADAYCKANLKTRKVAHLNEDPELKEIHETLLKKTGELEELMGRVTQLQKEVGSLAAGRWEKTVSKYGLNPEERIYFIDEEEAVVEQLEIDCTDCKGAVRAKEIHQEVTNLFMQQQPKSKEKDDDGPGKGDTEPEPSEGDAGESGEAGDGEQEVQGVSAERDPSGGAGDDSPPETD